MDEQRKDPAQMPAQEYRPEDIAQHVTEAYRKAIADAGGMDALTAALAAMVARDAAMRNATAALKDTVAATAARTQIALKGIADFVNSDAYKAIKEHMAAILSSIAQRSAEIAALSGLAGEIQNLAPFLSIELEAMQQDPAFADVTLQDILEQGFDEDGNPTDSPFRQIIEQAKQRQADFEAAEDTIETVESIAAKLPLVQGLIPTAHTMPNNALMNTLQQKPAINAGAFDMTVSNARGRRKEITAYTMISFDPGETSIKITDAKLSEYERQVSDAIVSLWLEADKEKLPPIFTLDMIFRAMPGGSDKASPQQKGAITKAIEKFRHLHITVDATEEMRKRGIIGSNETFKLDNFYLSATHAEHKVKNGGQTVNAYKIDAEPIILTYCTMTKQLLTIPAKYIAVEKVKNSRASGELLPMTANRQAMTGYILRRIEVMKRDEREAKEKNALMIGAGQRMKH